MDIQNPAKEDLGKLDKLISGVFLKNPLAESMAERFESLLSEDNSEHINCIYNGENPVTAVNWYSSSIKCEDAVITVGGIGAVCCDEKERGKGYADTLLKHSFEQMKNEGVAICFISGRMGIYFRNDAFVTGKEYEFSFSEKEKSDRVLYASNSEMYKCAGLVQKIHNLRENRFIRSFEHTKTLLKSFGCPLHNMVCELYYTDGAYAIVEVNKDGVNENEILRVVEYSGDSAEVVRILKHICFKTGKMLRGKIEYFDKDMQALIKDINEINLNGTVKIINPEILFKQLKYSFLRSGIENISIKEENGRYTICADGESYSFDFSQLHSLVFEGTNAPEKLKNVFPVHMPIIDGLDFI